jgi:hypothetical protein
MLRVTSVGVTLVGSIVAVNDTRLWMTLQRLLSAWPEWVLVIMWLCGYILTIIIIKLYVRCMSVAGGTHEADYNSPRKKSDEERRGIEITSDGRSGLEAEWRRRLTGSE